MRKIVRVWIFFLFALTAFSSAVIVSAGEDDEDLHPVVYFKIEGCPDCIAVENEGLIDDLRAQGLEVEQYDIAEAENERLFLQFGATYDPRANILVPVIFAGEDYYEGFRTIRDATRDGSIRESALDPLLDIEDTAPFALEGWGGFVRVVTGALIASFNPCAIAMLLMFISMLGFLKSNRVLVFVSVAFIGAIFAVNFLFGVLLLNIFRTLGAIRIIAWILYLLFAILCVYLFLITFMDFLNARKTEYGKIRNQLPKRIRQFNERVMERFTSLLQSDEGGVRKRLYILGVPFLIGMIVGVTEALCTGQTYIIIINSIRDAHPVTGRLYLLLFNIIFVTPLIIIAFIAIRSKNVMGISDFFRRHMGKVKFAASLFFLFMAAYFILHLAGIDLFRFFL